MRWIVSLLACCLSASAQYLFVSFTANGEHGVHYSLSDDGYRFTPLKDGQPWLRPQHPGQLMRDPFVTRGPSGKFHMVWTWSWTAQKFGYAESSDLVTWSEQREVPLFAGSAAKNVWAPEIYWHAARRQWMIVWASTVPGSYAIDEKLENGYNHRLYKAFTPDFRQLSTPEIFFDPGYNVIDATLLPRDGGWLMVFKDERLDPLQKRMRLATAPSLDGPWTNLSAPLTEEWSEGPSILPIGPDFLVYYDHYRRPQGYRGVRTRDFRAFEDVTSQISFPAGHRHGSFLKLTPQEAARLRR